jgi:hypothetical protein
MPADGNRDDAPAAHEPPTPAAVFKNSLRGWQARWKEQRLAATPAAPARVKTLRSKGRRVARPR